MNRSPYQGVANIIRFNPGFFIAAAVITLATTAALLFTSGWLQMAIALALTAALASLTISLIASHHIYDRSNIYNLPSLKNKTPSSGENWLSITAGFDEITPTLKTKFPHINLRTLDFYNPEKHTEPSIARARRAYPPHPNTEKIPSHQIPAKTNSIQTIIAFFSLHEIRNDHERIKTFQELHRILKTDGEIHLTEHLRDIPNLLAYNLGALHFHSFATWQKTFQAANLTIKTKIRTTPFVTTFVLIKK